MHSKMNVPKKSKRLIIWNGSHRYTIFVTFFCFNFVLHNSMKLDAFTDNFATESAFLKFFEDLNLTVDY